MNSYRTRNGVQTRTAAGPRSTTSSASKKAIPKTFTASPKSITASNSTAEQRKTFTNRVNRKGPAYRPPAPPKFLQRTGATGQEQVKPATTEAEVSSSGSKTTSTLTRTLRNNNRTKTGLRQQPALEAEDPAIANTGSTEDKQESQDKKKEKSNLRRHDPLVYRSKNCTFNQDYLDLLTFDPATTSQDHFTFSDEEEEKEEAPKVALPLKKTFKPYVKKDNSSGFGFWTSGLEDSLLSSGFSYKPAVGGGNKKPKDTAAEHKRDVSPSPPALSSRTAMTSSPLFF
mmetsp:Transcript_27323/g.66320  ORF Transcript_27323/g.66320 Transcript_27323/m.66320 type:complete len:285 (+) Transcript_27323:419-1273(+)